MATTNLQLLMCRRGEDIILVTLNHLDTIRKLVGESAEYHISLIDTAIKTLTDVRVVHLVYYLCVYDVVSVLQPAHCLGVYPTEGNSTFSLPGHTQKGMAVAEASWVVAFKT